MTIQGCLGCAAALAVAVAVSSLPAPPLLGAAAKGGPAAKAPAAPAAQPAWGAPTGGYETMLTLEAGASVGGKLVFRLALRGTAGQAVKLGPAKGLSGWLLIAQDLGDSKRTLYSDKLEVVPVEWPQELAEGQAVQFKPIDLSGSAAYPSEGARKLLTYYLSGEGAENIPKPVGRLNETLIAGPAFAKFTLRLPGATERPVPVPSNTLEMVIRPPDFKSLSPEARKAFAADLLKQFNRSAWGGKQAHDAAIAIGPAILPDLARAAFETDRPDFARMWLATTLADLRDARSAEALVKLLDDADGGVRAVAAYHGVKQASPAFDKALLEKVRSAPDAGLAAWALLGYLVFRGEVPEEILRASLESSDPRARAKAAEVLAGKAAQQDVARLLALLQDKDPRVRMTAASVLGKMRSPSPKVIGGLVKALDLADENLRKRVCEALSELTGRPGPYDPKADEAARKKTLAGWKEWWAKEEPK